MVCAAYMIIKPSGMSFSGLVSPLFLFLQVDGCGGAFAHVMTLFLIATACLFEMCEIANATRGWVALLTSSVSRQN